MGSRIKTLLLKLIIFMTALLVAIPSAYAEGDIGANIEIGGWYTSWDQTSDNAGRFGNNAIKTHYSINDALATSFDFGVHYKKLSWNTQYIKAQEMEKYKKSIEGITAVINYSGFLGNVDLNARYVKGSFNGFILGEDNQGTIGTGTFKTDLNIYDLVAFPTRYIGIGYRYLNYEFPQDLYLVKKESPNTIIKSGFEEISYKGHFAQLMIDNERLLSDDSGIVFGIRGGYGILKPSGKFLKDTENLLKANGLLGSGENLMSDGTTYFIEAEAGYRYRKHLYSRIIGEVYAGYMYDQLKAAFNAESTYTFVSDFTTRFSGPFISIKGSF